jgi:RNA polymerase sigma factor (sigma-70 family)
MPPVLIRTARPDRRGVQPDQRCRPSHARVKSPTHNSSPSRPAGRPLDSSQQTLAKQWMPAAYKLAWACHRKRRSYGIPLDELIGEALYALTYAAGRYDAARGILFCNYAGMVIRHRLGQLVNNWRRFGRAGDMPLDDDGLTAEHQVVDPAPDVQVQAAAVEEFERVRRSIPPRWWEVLRLRHVEGQTLEDIGERFGVTRQAVRQAEKRVRMKVRKAIGMATA